MTVTEPDVDWDALFQPWNDREGKVSPERQYTPWADPGWLAWNGHAVEVQIADFLAQLAKETSRDNAEWLCIETGVGQGYVTRRIASAVIPTQVRGIWTFESDPEWNGRIRELPYWPENLHICIKWEWTPTPHQMRDADLVIVDSRNPWRMMETMLWSEVGKPGSLLFVHDTGTLHHASAGHSKNRFLIKELLGLTGYWLENPRGAFLAQKGRAEPEARYKELWDSTLEQVRSFE